jgi:biotin carboxyl carrier protein
LQYEIEAGGRVRQVTIDRQGDRFAIGIDGRLHEVDAARIDAHSLSLIVESGVPAGPRVAHETTVIRESGDRLVVLVGSQPVTLRLNRRRGGSQESGAARSGPLRITAPMPGKVVRLLASVGDAVRTRQPVVVVEAMKMENELRADRDGTVAEIHTREGDSVEAGALLIVIQ